MKKKSLLKITLFFKLIKVLILAFVFIPGAFSKDKLSKNKKEKNIRSRKKIKYKSVYFPSF